MKPERKKKREDDRAEGGREKRPGGRPGFSGGFRAGGPGGAKRSGGPGQKRAAGGARPEREGSRFERKGPRPDFGGTRPPRAAGRPEGRDDRPERGFARPDRASKRPGGSPGRPERGTGFARGPGRRDQEGDRPERRPGTRPPFRGGSRPEAASGEKSFGGKRPFRKSFGGEGGREGDRAERPRFDRPRSDRPRPAGGATDRPRFSRGGNEPGDADRPRFDRPRTERPASGRPRFDRPRTDHTESDRPRFSRPRAERPGTESDRPRFGRPRAERPGSDRPRPERRPGFARRDEEGGEARPYGDRETRRPRPAGTPFKKGLGGSRPLSRKPAPSDRSERPYAREDRREKSYRDRPARDTPPRRSLHTEEEGGEISQTPREPAGPRHRLQRLDVDRAYSPAHLSIMRVAYTAFSRLTMATRLQGLIAKLREDSAEAICRAFSRATPEDEEFWVIWENSATGDFYYTSERTEGVEIPFELPDGWFRPEERMLKWRQETDEGRTLVVLRHKAARPEISTRTTSAATASEERADELDTHPEDASPAEEVRAAVESSAAEERAGAEENSGAGETAPVTEIPEGETPSGDEGTPSVQEDTQE